MRDRRIPTTSMDVRCAAFLVGIGLDVTGETKTWRRRLSDGLIETSPAQRAPSAPSFAERRPLGGARDAHAKDRFGTDEPPNKKPPACTEGFVQFATQILSADRYTGL
jgi:hypothetical protein